MKTVRVIAAAVVAFLAGSVWVFAAQEPNAAPAAAAKADANAPGANAGDSAAVIVNGVSIMESQVEAMLQDAIRSRAGKITPELSQQLKKQMRPYVVEELIAEHLLDQKIKQRKLTVTEADVDGEIARLLAQEGLSRQDFEALLGTYGTSLEKYKKQVWLNKRLLYEKFFAQELAGKINIADAQLEKYYRDNIEQFTVPEKVQLGYIFWDSGNAGDQADPARPRVQLRAKAEQVLAQIKGGASFEELASVQEPGRIGGDLGFRDRDAMLPEKLKEVAFSLPVGKVSDVVETEYGFFIIKATGRKESIVKALGEVRAQILQKLTEQERQRLIKQHIEALKAVAEIKYPPGKEPTGTLFNQVTIAGEPNQSADSRVQHRPAAEQPESSQPTATGK
jgi:parvulin-like peptidyl-prolyl isomerase